MHSSTTFGRGVHLTQGYAGHRGDMPQPVSMVQCGGVGVEKVWITLLLCRFLQAQHTYQEGVVSIPINSGSTGEYGRHHILLHNGFQEQILASEDGT